MIIYAYLSGFLILLTSLSGKLVVWGALGKFLQKNLKFMVTLAMGVFTATLYIMFNEAREVQASISQIAIVGGLGAVLLELLQFLIPDGHHHHGAKKEECCEHKHTVKINTKRVLLGDAIHNIGDGLVLIPAYSISIEAGILLTVGILLHEFVQETSEFFILKEAGYTTGKALLSNFIVQTSIFIGLIIATIITQISGVQPMLIALSIGALLYIILRDLLPHTLERVKHGGNALTHLLVYVFGASIMLVLSALIQG